MISIQSGAQPVSFVHIQTENDQPYRVVWNGTKYPSSASGYLVIPKVPAGLQVLTIEYSDETGFTATYTFSVEMTDKPRGFSLRQAVDNSWSLFDMVDLNLLQGVFVQPVVKSVVPDKITEPIQAVKKDEKPAIIIPVVNKEPVIAKEKAITKPTTILKIFEKSGAGGIDQVYVLTIGTRSDTIALFIPVIAEKNEVGSNPSVLQHIRSSGIDLAGKMVFTRPRNPVSISK